MFGGTINALQPAFEPVADDLAIRHELELGSVEVPNSTLFFEETRAGHIFSPTRVDRRDPESAAT
jgi:hypothetical protein